jgi:hypothetical protein
MQQFESGSNMPLPMAPGCMMQCSSTHLEQRIELVPQLVLLLSADLKVNLAAAAAAAAAVAMAAESSSRPMGTASKSAQSPTQAGAVLAT